MIGRVRRSSLAANKVADGRHGPVFLFRAMHVTRLRITRENRADTAFPPHGSAKAECADGDGLFSMDGIMRYERMTL